MPDADLTARLDHLRATGVDAVRVTYADLHGVARGKDIPLEMFPHAVDEGLAFCVANLSDGLAFSLANLAADSPTVGHRMPAGGVYPDMRIRPLISTLAPVPWEPSKAWCIAHVDPGDPSSAAAPRNVLERAVAGFSALGLSVVTGPELEFYLASRGPDGRITRMSDALCMIYTVGERADPTGVVRDMLRFGSQLGLGVAASHRECGRGQYEINLTHSDALDAADRAFRFKHMVKEVAAQRGFLATFMGKPFGDDASSGFHLHVSVTDGETNRFFDRGADGGLSTLGRRFLAGVLDHAPALTALYSPTINSYKRLVPGNLVPVVADWGWDNRTTYVRVPPERGGATRLELRAADAAANPYLVAAATLFAGLHGIEAELTPAPAETARTSGRGRKLPRTLDESLCALEADTWLAGALGQPLVNAFCAVKAMEIERFRLHVTEWELDEYAWHL